MPMNSAPRPETAAGPSRPAEGGMERLDMKYMAAVSGGCAWLAVANMWSAFSHLISHYL